jgi:signal transduction histidine kinase
MQIREICAKVRIVEWLLICLNAFGQWLWVEQTHSLDRVHLVSFVLLAVLFGLVSYNPANLKAPQRFLYLITQTVLVTAAMVTGLFRTYGLLYFVLALKGALLLSTRGIVAMVLLMVSLRMVGMHLATDYSKHIHALAAGAAPSHPWLVMLEQQLFFCTAIIIAAMFGRTFLAEQRSRRSAEHLAKEVDHMAVVVERARIARDIHDTLGHSLTSLNIQLELTEKLLSENDQQSATESIKTCRQIAGTSLQEVRKAIQSIKEDDFDLKDAIQSIANKVQDQQKIDVEVSIDGDNFSTSSRHNILLIVKECLTNVQKHANASQVAIHLNTDRDKAELLVSDNGCGFMPDREAEGFGIKGMQDRVASLGGTLKIESKRGEGTKIQVEVPN